MVKIIFGCLFLVLGVALGCDDDGGGMAAPTPTPIPTFIPECIDPADGPVFQCPTDILAQVCENQGFICNFFRIDPGEDLLAPLDLFGLFWPQGDIFGGQVLSLPCDYIGCFAMECDTVIEDVDRRTIGHRKVIFSDILPLGELQGGLEHFTAKADVEDFGVFNAVGCAPGVP